MRAIVFSIGQVFATCFSVLPAAAMERLDPAIAASWPSIDPASATVDLGEVISGGPGRDGILAIDAPIFDPVAASALADREPVISLEIEGEARAYPLQIMIWHEIVNDVVGGVPVAVTYCPLCNAAIVFDRRVPGAGATTFGVSGLLRRSDLIMYDRASESWWQQFGGEAIAGARAGARLVVMPSRLEAFGEFRARRPGGRVLTPNDPAAHPYGRNPYVAYDSARTPFLYLGSLPPHIGPMERVIVVDGAAWELARIRDAGVLVDGDLRFRVTGAMASALDVGQIADGRPIASVVVDRRNGESWEPTVHHATFAFVFHAFHPDGEWR